MNFNEDKWKVDRAPSKFERVYGTAFALIIFAFMSLFLIVEVSMILDSEDYLKAVSPSFFVAIIFFAGSTILLFRVVFGKRRKPSKKAIAALGYCIGFMGGICLLLSIAGIGNVPYLLGLGFTGLAGSTFIIKQGREREDS